MRATRRNVLVILGVLTIAGGALFGTGAFTQVSAERTVTAQTTGDSGAYLSLSGDGAYVSDSDNDNAIEFSFNRLNQNATSSFDGVLQITADPADSSGPYDLYVRNASNLGPNSVMDVQINGTSIVGQTRSVQITNGGTKNIDIVFDTTGSNDASNAPSSISIVASEQ